MLGENHSLLNDFSEDKTVIETLIKQDHHFARDAKKYNDLDTKIRKLELRNAPIGDDEMHALKHERSVLKDSLYKRILAAKK